MGISGGGGEDLRASMVQYGAEVLWSGPLRVRYSCLAHLPSAPMSVWPDHASERMSDNCMLHVLSKCTVTKISHDGIMGR